MRLPWLLSDSLIYLSVQILTGKKPYARILHFSRMGRDDNTNDVGGGDGGDDDHVHR